MSNLLKQQIFRQFRVFISRKLSIGATATNTKPLEKHYDIIIGGGGLVGTTLAAALSSTRIFSDKRVLLLEGGPPIKAFDKKGAYGNRVSAINHKSVELFKSIGAWELMTAERVKFIKQMQVWDASSDALINFHHEHFSDDIACIIENDLMLSAVHKVLKDNCDTPNVHIRNGVRIGMVSLPADNGTDHSEVCLDSGEKLTCDLLIGADGVSSVVRQQMGVDVFSIDYQRLGLVATIKVSEADENAVAWQRFIPTGPIALLPLDETTSSLVWSTTVARAKELKEMSSVQFVDAINEAFVKEYPKKDLVVSAVNALNSLMGRESTSQQIHLPPRVIQVQDKSRATFPLGFLHAASYISSGAALVGDAAHRIHPLAGQGVNLGFSDISFLIDALSEAVYAGAKVGDKQYLLKYEQQSLINNIPIMVGVHGLQTLYSTNFSPVVLLRSLGLQLTHNIPSIKNFFMKRAIG